jgi:hypothetical protein
MGILLRFGRRGGVPMTQQPVVTKTGARCGPEFYSTVGSDAIVQQPTLGAWRIEETIDASWTDVVDDGRRKVAMNLIEAIEKMEGS